jgi:predicted transcriptional regulator
VTKPPKIRQKGDSNAKALKDAKIVADAMSGKTVKDISKEMGMNRTQVSKILNSEETKTKVKEIQGRLANLIDECLLTIEEAVQHRALDMQLAVGVARDVLKNFGALQSKVEVAHKFPTPVIITKRDGTEVILGTTADIGKEEEE